MNFSQRVLLPLILLTFSLPAMAECPMGTVGVRGRLENLPADTTSAELTLTLETSKGPKSQAVPVSNGDFSVEIQFGTQSTSYFPLGGIAVTACRSLSRLMRWSATESSARSGSLSKTILSSRVLTYTG